MKNIKDLGEKEVILCTTIADCEAIAELLDSYHLEWADGDDYITEKPYLNNFIGKFCFRPYDGRYDNLDYYKKNKYTIHYAKDFLQETTKQVSNEVKEELQDILKEWTESRFQKGLNTIIRERLK